MPQLTEKQLKHIEHVFSFLTTCDKSFLSSPTAANSFFNDSFFKFLIEQLELELYSRMIFPSKKTDAPITQRRPYTDLAENISNQVRTALEENKLSELFNLVSADYAKIITTLSSSSSESDESKKILVMIQESTMSDFDTKLPKALQALINQAFFSAFLNALANHLDLMNDNSEAKKLAIWNKMRNSILASLVKLTESNERESEEILTVLLEDIKSYTLSDLDVFRVPALNIAKLIKQIIQHHDLGSARASAAQSAERGAKLRLGFYRCLNIEQPRSNSLPSHHTQTTTRDSPEDRDDDDLMFRFD